MRHCLLVLPEIFNRWMNVLVGYATPKKKTTSESVNVGRCYICVYVSVNITTGPSEFLQYEKKIHFLFSRRLFYSLRCGLIQHGVHIDFHQHRTFQFILNTIQLRLNLRA